jgi:hypothetical protein
MKTTRYGKLGNFLFLFIFILMLLLPGTRAALAAPLQQQASGGLSVDGALLELAATPGLVFVHKMKVSVGANAPALDVTVEAMGFGENLSGEFQGLAAADDTNPFSARSYITAISKPVFKINPGETVEVDATISVPADPGTDTRYATILIKGTPQTTSSVTQVLAVLVPVVVTPQGAQMNRTGAIADVKVDPVEAGKPIVVTTTVKNTGNRHFKIKGDVKIVDPSGQLVTDIIMPAAGNSIIPSFSRTVTATYSALDKTSGLAAGTYSAQVTITQDDGTAVDSKTASFEITKAYRPFPEIDQQHIQIKCFQDEEPGTVDARQTTDVTVTFEGTGKVTGCVAIGLFQAEPAGAPRFTDTLDTGGIGTLAVKHIGIQVQGFDQGVAHIGVAYRPNELNSADANGLFLAVRGGGFWKKLDKLTVQTGAQMVMGDIAVVDLKDGPVAALGVADNASLFTNPLVLGGIAAVVLLVLVLAVVLVRQRSPRK